MGLIRNFDQLATSPERKTVLQIVEAGLSSIQPENVMQKNFSLDGNTLKIIHKTYDLSAFDHIYLIGFGKGSAGIAKIIESALEDKLTEGYVIDASEAIFQKVHFTLGTHPLPSQENIDYTARIIERFSNLTERDLVLVVICGGGSVMFAHPQNISLEQLTEVNKALLHSGMDIYQMNTVRKHLDSVKGGGLAKTLYPATVASLIFSDVPGNDLSFIASGPTVKDTTVIQDALNLLSEFSIADKVTVEPEDFIETPKDEKYFTNVSDFVILSNVTALDTMKDAALKMGLNVLSLSDRVQGLADDVGKMLLDKTKPGHLLLAAGESTVKVKGEDGKGGRNLELVLSALRILKPDTVIISFASDGWDNTEFAGAIGDQETVKKAKAAGLKFESFIEKSDSFTFFKTVGDGIITGRLPSNVADLMVVFRT